MMRGRRAMDGLDQNIRDHIERETQDNIDKGMAPEEARHQAMLTFGNVALVKEDTRRIWVWAWLDEAHQDLRYAARTLRKNRAFATAAAATLALAIGANTTMFSVLNAVLLRPLPYRAPEQLAMLWTEDPHARDTRQHDRKGEHAVVEGQIDSDRGRFLAAPGCSTTPGCRLLHAIARARATMTGTTEASAMTAVSACGWTCTSVDATTVMPAQGTPGQFDSLSGLG